MVQETNINKLFLQPCVCARAPTQDRLTVKHARSRQLFDQIDAATSHNTTCLVRAIHSCSNPTTTCKSPHSRLQRCRQRQWFSILCLKFSPASSASSTPRACQGRYYHRHPPTSPRRLRQRRGHDHPSGQQLRRQPRTAAAHTAAWHTSAEPS